jgi:hypothetical protein
MACLTLAGLFTSLSAQQTTPPSSSPDSTSQGQPQSSSQGQAESPTQPPSSSDKSSGQNQGNQTPDTQTQGSQSQSNQSPNNQSQANGNQGNKPDQHGNSGQGKVAGTSNDRLFYALPNFLTLENADKVPPLTVKQKFKVVALGTFDPVNYPWWGTIAAIGQADNSEPGYGQGWVGYAKRYGATAGDSSIENFMVGAVLPSILRQDPRFYYSSKGGVFKRTTYAIGRVFVIRSDSGKNQFNFSEIFGAAIAAGISTNTYHPRGTYISTPSNPHKFIASDRTLTNTASVWATQVGLDSITFVIKEFWPDLHRKMARKREANATAAPGP